MIKHHLFGCILLCLTSFSSASTITVFTSEAEWKNAASQAGFYVSEENFNTDTRAPNYYKPYDKTTFQSSVTYYGANPDLNANWSSGTVSNGVLTDTVNNEIGGAKTITSAYRSGLYGVGAYFDLSPNGIESGIKFDVLLSVPFEGVTHYTQPSFTVTKNGFFGVILSDNSYYLGKSYYGYLNGLVVTSPGEETISIDNMVVAIPEPETYAMMLAGLGIVGATVRRKKSVQA